MSSTRCIRLGKAKHARWASEEERLSEGNAERGTIAELVALGGLVGGEKTISSYSSITHSPQGSNSAASYNL